MPWKFNPFTGKLDWTDPAAAGTGGDVFGPASATNNAVVLFDGTSGKLLKAGSPLGAAAFLAVGTTPGTVVAGDDLRLSNARTPTAHKASHATGGSDALSAADIGALPASAGLDALSDVAISSPALNHALVHNGTQFVNSLMSVVPAYTWAALPAAGAYIGRAYVTDVGIGGSFWYSNGTTWQVVGGEILLAQAYPNFTLAANTSEQVAYQYSLRAGLLGTNGEIQVVTDWACTNNSNTKFCATYLGGQTVAYAGFSNSAGNLLSASAQNLNSASSQATRYTHIGGQSFGTATAATGSAVSIDITGTKSTAGDTLTLRTVSIRLRRA